MRWVIYSLLDLLTSADMSEVGGPLDELIVAPYVSNAAPLCRLQQDRQV